MSVILGQYTPARTTYAYKAKQDNCGSEYSRAHANEYSEYVPAMTPLNLPQGLSM